MSKVPTVSCTRKYDMVTLADAEKPSPRFNARGTHHTDESRKPVRDRLEDWADAEIGTWVRMHGMGHDNEEVAYEIGCTKGAVTGLARMVRRIVK